MKRSYSLCTWVSGGGGSEGKGGGAALGPPGGAAFAPVAIPGVPPYIPAPVQVPLTCTSRLACLTFLWSQEAGCSHRRLPLLIQLVYTSCPHTLPRLCQERCMATTDGPPTLVSACRPLQEDRQHTWLLLLVGRLLGDCCISRIGWCCWRPIAVPWRLAVRARHWGIPWRRSAISWWRHAIHLQRHTWLPSLHKDAVFTQAKTGARRDLCEPPSLPCIIKCYLAFTGELCQLVMN